MTSNILPALIFMIGAVFIPLFRVTVPMAAIVPYRLELVRPNNLEVPKPVNIVPAANPALF